MPIPSKPPNRLRTHAQSGAASSSADAAIQRVTNWPLREIYATTVGIIGTVLAIPSVIHLSHRDNRYVHGRGGITRLGISITFPRIVETPHPALPGMHSIGDHTSAIL